MKKKLKTLIIGDVHGCSVELKEMISMVTADRIILVGDLFTKGPDPSGVWDLIFKHNIESVLGNHDKHLLIQNKSLGLPVIAIQYLEGLPLFIDGNGWRVVHAGVNPITHLVEERDSLYMRRWPNDSSSNNPFWWECYRGDKLIVYGHDAARGLQDHRPYTIGLDTGCVYGGFLSAYSPDADEFYTVKAKKSYVPIRIKPKG